MKGPPGRRRAALPRPPQHVDIATDKAMLADRADARQRRGARLAWVHLRARGLDCELVRRTLGVAS